MEKQKTLKDCFTLKGKGLHTGLLVTITFNPAPEDHGFKFQRIDLDNKPIIDAVADNVVNTTRSTVIGKGDVTVSTVEHALSALWALGIDNCLIEIDGPEVPILEGNAVPYVEKIIAAGIKAQTKKAVVFRPIEKMEYFDDKGCGMTILPDDKFSVSTLLSYPGSIQLSNQFATLENIEDYAKEVAPCKTFVFLHELEPLLKNNQVKGGHLDNALVIVDKKVSQGE